MKVEIPIEGSANITEKTSKLSISKTVGNESTTEVKPNVSYVCQEIKVFKDLKEG